MKLRTAIKILRSNNNYWCRQVDDYDVRGIKNKAYDIVKNVVIPAIVSVFKLVFFSWKLKYLDMKSVICYPSMHFYVIVIFIACRG